MLVGCSVGSSCFTLDAVCSLVTDLTADMASAMKSGSGTKLHKSITAVILLNHNWYSNMTFTFTSLIYMNNGKS